MAVLAASALAAPQPSPAAPGASAPAARPAARTPAPAPTPVPTQPTAPERVQVSSLKDLGAARPLMLRGIEGSSTLNLGVRLDEAVVGARLHLIFTASPALITGLSHIKVLLNEEALHTVRMEPTKLGTPQEVVLDLDPRFFTDFNQLRLQLIGHYTMECEHPNHSSLWAGISNESRLELRLRQLTVDNDLALLPAPFFDPRDNRLVELPVVYPPRPTPGLLRASGTIASWIGARADYRGARFPALFDRLPGRHAVVLATNAQRPQFLAEMPRVEAPTLQVISHPTVPGAKLLLVLGRDEEQVQTAAEALALNPAGLSGSRMTVGSLQRPPLRLAYDAPRWLPANRPVRLSEMVQFPGQLQLRGTTLNDTINVSMRMAPDLFTWNMRGVPLNLSYSYTPTLLSDRGSLNVSINDQFIKAITLRSSEQAGGSNNLELPLFDDSSLQAKADFKIPAFLIGGNNQLQLSFQLPPSDLGRCVSVALPELRAAIDPKSTLDLGGYHHYIAMPNLAAFANSGFPFTKYADLSQTAVVLPEQPTANEVELYLATLGRMGASTGLAATEFKLLSQAQVDEASGRDILLLGRAGNGNRDSLLTRWGHDLPALVEAGRRSLRPVERSLNTLQELFNLESGAHIASPGGQAILEGPGPLAALSGFESPLDADRSVVSMTASDDGSLSLIASALNDGGRVAKVRGDLSLLRGEAVESFRINPVYYIGDLPWWRLLWFYLHTHPIMLAILGLASGLMLAFIASVVLRAIARRRLEAGGQA